MSIHPNKTVLFVPRNLYLVIEHNDGDFSKLLNLNSVVSSYGQETAARFILANSLYNSQDVKNIFPSLSCLNFPALDIRSLDVTLQNESPKTYEQLQSRIEGLRLSGETFESLSDTGETLKANQYYATKLFKVAPEVFGVSVFVMDLPEDTDVRSIKKDHLLTQLNFLHQNGISTKDIAQTDVFKAYVNLVNEIATA